MEGPTILFLVGLALTCAVLLFRTHRQLSRPAKSEFPSPATFSPPAPAATRAHRLDAPREVNHWEVEMRELSRELQGQLDSKIAILQHLIRDARQQAERLEAALAQAAQQGRPISADSQTPPVERVRVRAERTTARPASPAARRHAEIYSLADAGLSSASIASRLGSPIGEVELILGLRQSDVA